MLRRTLDVTNVSAGSSNGDAANTIDDNELSDWSSDGKRENAWIRYELAKPEKIDQVVLKLMGWPRRRSAADSSSHRWQ